MMIDYKYMMKIDLIRCWDKWAIQDIIPVNSAVILSALVGLFRTPPRPMNYQIEIILGCVRIEKQIARINNINIRPCPVCDHVDSIYHLLLWCSNSQNEFV